MNVYGHFKNKVIDADHGLYWLGSMVMNSQFALLEPQ